MTRDEFIKAGLTGILERKTPPAAIRGNPDAQRGEVAAMVKTIARYAPVSGIDLWWDRFEDNLSRRMKTHGWPIPSEIDMACREVSGRNAQDGGNAVEQEILRMMTEWFTRFADQLPGHGRPDRTAELIRRGVLADEREARFKGFDLGEDQRRRAMDQRMGRDEWRHHIRVTARLRGVSEAEAEVSIRAEVRCGPLDRRSAAIPDKSIRSDWEGAA